LEVFPNKNGKIDIRWLFFHYICPRFRQLIHNHEKMKKVVLVLLCLITSMAVTVAQKTMVTGTVLSSEDGEPVIGASVMVKGTSVGTITDVNGRFELEAPSSARTMVI
jgi:hypothetical protein